MESLVADRWRGRRVFITGHTGFKGSWLSLWLSHLGARVSGFSLEPPTNPSLFEAAGISSVIAHDGRGDIRDAQRVREAIASGEPDVVFHLAAQPLVRESYRDPLGTFSTNVVGTANVLDALRSTPSVRAAVIVTTDKVYANREWEYPYREIDPLGGNDPYSASKAASELVIDSYRASFFSSAEASLRIASARAGNVFGGGDWATDRLVPDCLRAFAGRQTVSIRFPNSVRPWQHVLEPLAGYIRLAEKLLAPGGQRFAHPWNFGPGDSGTVTVGTLARMIGDLWGEGRVEFVQSDSNPHESGLLTLDSTRANQVLGWRPRWSLEQGLRETVAWHRAWLGGLDVNTLMREQISTFMGASG